MALLLVFLLLVNTPIVRGADPTSIDLWNSDTEVEYYEDVVFAATLVGGKSKESVSFVLTRNNDSLEIYNQTDETDKYGVALVQFAVHPDFVSTNYTLTTYPTDYPYINDSVNITINALAPDYIPFIRLSPHAIMEHNYGAIFEIQSDTKPEDNVPLNVKIIDPYTNETPCNRTVYTDSFGIVMQFQYMDPAIFEVDKHYICRIEVLNKSNPSEIITSYDHGFLTVPGKVEYEYVYSGGSVFIPKKITVTEISRIGDDVVVNNNQIISIKYYKNDKLESVIATDGFEVIQQDRPYIYTYTFEVQVLKNGVLIDIWRGEVRSHWDELLDALF